MNLASRSNSAFINGVRGAFANKTCKSVLLGRVGGVIPQGRRRRASAERGRWRRRANRVGGIARLIRRTGTLANRVGGIVRLIGGPARLQTRSAALRVLYTGPHACKQGRRRESCDWGRRRDYEQGRRHGTCLIHRVALRLASRVGGLSLANGVGRTIMKRAGGGVA